jgi:mRNA interferase YafQ
MREIEPTTRFRRDNKRGKKGRHAKDLDRWLTDVITALAADLPLAERYRDHALTGDWADHRDFHVMSGLIWCSSIVWLAPRHCNWSGSVLTPSSAWRSGRHVRPFFFFPPRRDAAINRP